MTDSSSFSREALSILATFGVLIRKYGFYPPGHPYIERALGELDRGLAHYFRKHNSLVVGIGQDRLYLGDKEIADLDWAIKFSQSLHQHSVSKIILHRGLEQKELQSFLDIFNTDPLEAREQGGYAQLLQTNGISSIEVDEVDYKLQDGNVEQQLRQMTDNEVWERIAQSWRPGRRTLKDEDRELVSTLLSNAPRMAEMLEAQVGSGVSEKAINDGINIFFDIIQNFESPDKSRSAREIAERFARVIHVLSPKARFAMLRKAIQEKEKMPDKKPLVWQLLHRFSPRDLAASLFEGLDPDFSDIADFEKCYLHFVGPNSEKGVLERIERLVLDRDIRYDRTLFKMVENVNNIRENHPALGRLAKRISAVANARVDNELPVQKFMEEMADKKTDIAADLALPNIEKAAIENQLQALKIAKSADVYSQFTEDLGANVEEMIRTGRYQLAADALSILIDHADAKNPDAERRVRAAEILQSIRRPEVAGEIVAALQKWGKRESEILCKILCFLGDAAPEAILDALEAESNRGTRAVMLDVLAKLGDLAVPAAKKRMQSDEWFIVRNMITVLSKLKTDDLLESLKPILAHKEARVRKEAVKAIASYGCDESVDMLIELINDPSSPVRQQALFGLGRYRDSEKALKALTDHLSDAKPFSGDIAAESMALQALGKFCNSEALKLLSGYISGFGVFKVRDEKVITAAVSAIAGMDLPEVQKILKKGSRSLSSIINRECKKALESRA